MSDRERWILYPLIVFAISLGLRPFFLPPDSEFESIKCGHLRCDEVTVIGIESKERIAHLGPTSEGRAELVLFGPDKQARVRLEVEPEGKSGVLEGTTLRIKSSDGRRLAEIAPGAQGLAAITLFATKDTEPLVRLQAAEQGAVLESLRSEKSVWPAEK